MATRLVHKHIDLYTIAKKLVQVCYEIVQEFPEEERLLSGQKLKTAILSAYISIIEAISQKWKKKLFKKARLNLFAVEALLEIYKEMSFISSDKKLESDYLLNRCFELLNTSKN